MTCKPRQIIGSDPLAAIQRDYNRYGDKIIGSAGSFFPSFTEDQPPTQINAFDDHTDFVNQGNGTVATDATIFYDQAASVRMDMGAGQNVNLRLNLPAPIDLTKTSLTFAMRTQDRANIIASTVTLWEGANTSIIEGLTGRYMRHDLEWTPMALNMGDLIAGGTADLTKIDRVNVRCASTTAASVWLNSLGFMANAFPLEVYITFDDGNESDITVAKPILDAAGLIASSFQYTSLIGTAGKLTAANLQTLQSAGWNIGSHSSTHIDFETATEAQQRADLQASKDELLSAGINASTFAYPFSRWDELSESLVPIYFPLRMDGTEWGAAPSRSWVGRIYREDGEVAVVSDLTDHLDKLAVHGGAIGIIYHQIDGAGYDIVKFQAEMSHIEAMVLAGTAIDSTPDNHYRT